MAGAKPHEEEAQALNDLQKWLFGFTKTAAVRCAIELRLPDIVENHAGCVTLRELSSQLGCSSSFLTRLMRFLTHHHIFKEVKMEGQDSPISYTGTAFSRLLTKDNMAPFYLLINSPEFIAAMLSLSKYQVEKNRDGCAFETAHGMDLWQYIEANPSFGEEFHKAMSCRAQSTISKVLGNCMTAFEGIGCLVDVGGGDGTTLHAVVKACPWINRAINFDLPHVVSSLKDDGRVEHVGGDMFVSIPSADAAFIMRGLHNWDDEACVKILKNCREAIPKENGKVIIVDVVLNDDEGNNKYRDFQLALDMVVMSLSNEGKERTAQEWANLLASAGFSKHTIKHIPALESVIEAYP